MTQIPGWYVNDYGRYMQRAPETELVVLSRMVDERTPTTTVDPWYFHQDIWAARKVLQRNPAWLLDVGGTASYIGFMSLFRPVTSVELRPMPVETPGLTQYVGSVTDLPFDTGTVPMASCLSVIEHVGLGRYGDNINPYGSVQAIVELERVLQPGGRLLLSVPVGPEAATLFNEHRLLDYKQVMAWMEHSRLVDHLFIEGRGMVVWCAEFVKRG
jgi:SAM-dependent methyltransferase